MEHNWMISPHSGTESSYILTTNPYHGVYIANTDTSNSLVFNIASLGNVTLLPNQQYREFFKEPFTTVSVTNPSGCKFILGRLE